MNHLRVGARGSELSLAQTRWVIEELRHAHPAITTEIVIIQTHGDRDQSTPLSALGEQGGFVKDIERALLDDTIDLAVHSLKDVPTEETPGLFIAAVPRRAPAGDVLLTRERISLGSLPAGFVIGSSSPRRSHQIRRWATHVVTRPLRGNVPTRIRHLNEGAYDGVILAAAGLERLGIDHPFRAPLPIEDFLPAPGQGALGIQVKQGGPAAPIVEAIDHAPTRIAVYAERSFLRATGGGCHAALGAWATLDHTLTLRGEVFIGGHPSRARIHGPADNPETLGRRLASMLVPTGARVSTEALV